MPSFPEEQLNSPAGYFAAQPGQILNNGQWKILRKLGWGPRSSSWLAVDTEDPDNTEVLKVFTVRATEGSSASKELDLLKGALKSINFYNGPLLCDDFYQVGPTGKHLVQVLRPLGSSVEALRLSNTESGEYLPVHSVQKIVSNILEPLCVLDKIKIIHGAVVTDNFLFGCFTSANDLAYSYKDIPVTYVETVSGSDGTTYPVTTSQPISHDLTWDGMREKFADTKIYLSNFGHAHHVGKNISFDAAPNLLPPETLFGGSVGTKANIWQLGATAYLLLTSNQFFSSSYVKMPESTLEEKLINLEQDLKLSGKISPNDIPDTASFLQSCLAFDATERPSAYDLIRNIWVQKGATCSCGWCAAEGH